MKYCNKCGAKIKGNTKFCNKCGNKIEKKQPIKEDKIEHKPHHTHHKKSYSTYIWIAVFLILFAGIVFPTKNVEYQVEVPYEDVEYYTEKEPYETQEAYEKQVPYEATETYVDTVPVEREVPYTDYETESWYDYTTDCDYSSYCSCTGTSWWTGKCNKCYCSKTNPVTKYKKEIIDEEVEKERAITKYKTVIDYKTVTKYKDVQKSREVMNTKMETRIKKVNWLFGFEVPW